MKTQNNLLSKYYKGETSLEEEEQLKNSNLSAVENDVFGYFKKEGLIPENLEQELFEGLESERKKKKMLKRWIYSISSAAAVLLIFISIFLQEQYKKNQQLENQFFVLEQAMFQVSESIQPEEPDEMFVLWVDDNVEIIIN